MDESLTTDSDVDPLSLTAESSVLEDHAALFSDEDIETDEDTSVTLDPPAGLRRCGTEELLLRSTTMVTTSVVRLRAATMVARTPPHTPSSPPDHPPLDRQDTGELLASISHTLKEEPDADRDRGLPETPEYVPSPRGAARPRAQSLPNALQGLVAAVAGVRAAGKTLAAAEPPPRRFSFPVTRAELEAVVSRVARDFVASVLSRPPAEAQAPSPGAAVPPAEAAVPPAEAQVPPAEAAVPPAEAQVPPAEAQVPELAEPAEPEPEENGERVLERARETGEAGPRSTRPSIAVARETAAWSRRIVEERQQRQLASTLKMADRASRGREERIESPRRLPAVKPSISYLMPRQGMRSPKTPPSNNAASPSPSPSPSPLKATPSPPAAASERHSAPPAQRPGRILFESRTDKLASPRRQKPKARYHRSARFAV